MPSRHYYGKRYRSEDSLVDWIFRRFIWLLNKKIRGVILRTPLRNPDKPRKRIFGLWVPQDDIVDYGSEKLIYEECVLYLDPDWHEKKKEELLKTLIHELCHALTSTLLYNQDQDSVICQLEGLLFEKLSPAQKRALLRYIPKKIEE